MTNYEPWDDFWLWVARTVPAWLADAPLPILERIAAARARRLAWETAMETAMRAAASAASGMALEAAKLVAAFAAVAASAAEAFRAFGVASEQAAEAFRQFEQALDKVPDDGYLKED